MEKKCPCCSGKEYEACCKPYHDGESAPTALALMRSRYSAYALKKAGYILKTTHPKSPYFEKDKSKWEKAVLQFSNTTEFQKLEILSSSETIVTFAAHLSQNGACFVLEEESVFEKIDGRWLYLRGKTKTHSA